MLRFLNFFSSISNNSNRILFYSFLFNFWGHQLSVPSSEQIMSASYTLGKVFATELGTDNVRGQISDLIIQLHFVEYK